MPSDTRCLLPIHFRSCPRGRDRGGDEDGSKRSIWDTEVLVFEVRWSTSRTPELYPKTGYDARDAILTGMIRESSLRSQRERLRRVLRDARLERGLRQVDLGDRLGEPQSFVSKYECGERELEFVEVLTVCSALALAPDELIERVRGRRHAR
ncbi:MAG: helix-turn-helix transcriptional regulator [Phycisphaerales bacterium]